MLRRRISRKGKKNRDKSNTLRNEFPDLSYLGSGSYGSVYEIKGTQIALKEHRISNINDPEFCEDWKKEFEMQKAVHESCNDFLNTIGIGIVKPLAFSYGIRKDDTILRSQNNVKGASSCFFTMEQVPGAVGAPPYYFKKLYKLLKSSVRLQNVRIPSYLQLGTLQNKAGHISLDMLQGATVIEFPNESYNYAIVEGIGLELLKNTFLSFFKIAESGFIPRDIEYVFNGDFSDVYVKILDFNEVKPIEERSKGRTDYDLEEDLAHVYIDLCGLRSLNTKNPQAPYDIPTPQWKFLCSPIVSPHAFFTCISYAKSAGFKKFRIEKIADFILKYAEQRMNAHNTTDSIPWDPPSPSFSKEGDDSVFQKYFLQGLYETAVKRNICVDPSQFADYETTLAYFQSLLNAPAPSVEEGDDWIFPFSEGPVRKDLPNMPFFKKRKFTFKKRHH
jgi:hypothetical protein